MTFPSLSRPKFLLVSLLILAVQIAGAALIVQIYLGWQTDWYLYHNAARGNATLVMLLFFTVIVVVQVVVAMFRLKDAGVAVWFALAYSIPLLFVAFFDAMFFALLLPFENMWSPIVLRFGAIGAWLAILLVPSAGRRSGKNHFSAGRSPEPAQASSGSVLETAVPGALPLTHEARPQARQRPPAPRGGAQRSFGKRGI